MKKLLSILLLFASLHCCSQYYVQLYQYGIEERRRAVDSTLFYPTGCGAPSLRGSIDLHKSALFFDSCNHRLWVYDSKKAAWDTAHLGVASGSGSGSTLTINSPLTGTSYNGSTPITIGLDTAHWHSYAFYQTQFYPLGSNPSNYLTSIDTSNIASFSAKVRSLFSATAPVTYSNGLVGLDTVHWHSYAFYQTQFYPLASNPSGYLTSISTLTINSPLTGTSYNGTGAVSIGLNTGNLTDAGTDGITVTNGAGSVVGTGTSLSQHVADGTHNGYLAQGDFSTFNGKQNALSSKLGKDFTMNGDSLFLKGDYVNVLDFGAVADNSTDNSNALAAAVATGKPVFIPVTAQTINYSTGITLAKSQVIFGMGRGSQLKYTGTSRAITVLDSSIVSNFRLTGNGKASGHAFESGVFCWQHTNWVIQNMFIDNFGGSPGANGGAGIEIVGLAAAEADGGNVINCHVQSCNSAINIEARGEYVNITGGNVDSSTTGIALGGGNFSVQGVTMIGNTTGVKVYSGVNNGHGAITGCLINHSTLYALDIQNITPALGISFTNDMIYYGALFFNTANNIRFVNCNLSSLDSCHLDSTSDISRTSCLWGQTALGGVIPISKFRSATDMEVIGETRFNPSGANYWIKQVNGADTILFSGPFIHTGFGSLTSATGAIANTDTKILASDLAMQSSRLIAGSVIEIELHGTCTSTAAGAGTINIRYGTTGTTSDGLLQSFTLGAAQTSGTSIPFKIKILITIRTSGASATSDGELELINQGTTGISTTATQVIRGTATNINTTTALTFLEADYQSGNASTATTFQDAVIKISYK